jgi:hypothetical protein
MARSWRQSSEYSNFITFGEFLDELRNHQLLMKESFTRSYLVNEVDKDVGLVEVPERKRSLHYNGKFLKAVLEKYGVRL